MLLAGALLLSLVVHLTLIFTVRGLLTGDAPANRLHARLVTSRAMQPSATFAEVFSPPQEAVVEITQKSTARQRAVGKAIAKKVPAKALPPQAAALPLPFDPVFYTWREVDVVARPRADANPPHPAGALQAGVGGRVVLEVWLDETGKVDDAKVIEAAPPGYFEAATLAYYRALAFAPAMKDGRARRFRGRYEVVFEAAR